MIFCFFLRKWDYSAGNFMSLELKYTCFCLQSAAESFMLCFLNKMLYPSFCSSPHLVSPPELIFPRAVHREQLPHSCFAPFLLPMCGLLYQVHIQWWWGVTDSRTVGVSEAESPKSVVLMETASFDCCLSWPFILPQSLWMKLYFRFVWFFHTV